MSRYNIIERRVAGFLECAPLLKSAIKFFYSRSVYFFFKKRHKFQSPYIHTKLNNEAESFFGYYDKSPANHDGLVLTHLSNFCTFGKPDTKQPIELALFSSNMECKLWSTDTNCYNWQQGSRLHWLDDEIFIYNDFDSVNQRYIARVVSSKSLQQFKFFEAPVQDSFGTIYFLSINYQRLLALRPDYGYRNLPPLNETELRDMHNDGIWKVDYKTGKTVLLVSLANICEVMPRPEFSDAFHKVNHVMISPDGSQFIFLHRYLIGRRRFDRLLLGDAISGKLRLLADYGMVSHYFWRDNNTIFGFMRGPNKNDAYWSLDVNNSSISHVSVLDGSGDGHPHVSGDSLVTDSYPDKSRMQHLHLMNLKTKEVEKIGEFFHGFEYVGESRCDLHPRFSPCGKFIFFDSIYSGKRELCRFSINISRGY